mmetsp:Transcript_14311/g.53941  ORF Transcript_14311/g.53941 Transcript_14311/m.53941 type:complete len:343 (-) Transcript_14311:1537-2565(-)
MSLTSVSQRKALSVSTALSIMRSNLPVSVSTRRPRREANAPESASTGSMKDQKPWGGRTGFLLPSFRAVAVLRYQPSESRGIVRYPRFDSMSFVVQPRASSAVFMARSRAASKSPSSQPFHTPSRWQASANWGGRRGSRRSPWPSVDQLMSRVLDRRCRPTRNDTNCKSEGRKGCTIPSVVRGLKRAADDCTTPVSCSAAKCAGPHRHSTAFEGFVPGAQILVGPSKLLLTMPSRNSATDSQSKIWAFAATYVCTKGVAMRWERLVADVTKEAMRLRNDSFTGMSSTEAWRWALSSSRAAARRHAQIVSNESAKVARSTNDMAASNAFVLAWRRIRCSQIRT